MIATAPATDYDALMDAVAEKMAKEQAIAVTPQAVAEIRKRIRWEVADHGRKIRIMKCGSKVAGVSNVLMEISATNKKKDLWKLCEKALTERASRVSATGSNRVSHDGIELGIEVAE
jgi:hypothetical protein